MTNAQAVMQGDSWQYALSLWPERDAAFHAPPQEREEIASIARARAGDEAGYRWLLERYRVRAVRLAAHVLRRPAEAEDVAQEAFVRAFQSLPSLRAQERFAPWLFRIVVRACLDRRRSARWKAEQTQAEISENADGGFAEAAQTRLVIESLLDSLSPPIRAALVLREIEGLEYEEIAHALNIPVGTVRSRLNAARAQFRALWTAATTEERQ